MITEAFENNESVQLCVLSEAIDGVLHYILLAKLRKYGISGVVLSLASRYLIKRKQFIILKGASSINKHLPQVCSLLFPIMVNNVSLNCRTMLFVDVTTLLSSGLDIAQLRTNTNNSLELSKA